MKLQDYINYYIGCEVIVDGKERAKLIGGSFVPNSCNQIYYDLQTEEMKVDDIDFAMPYNDDADDIKPRVKPLLRRLEDMTEEEARGFLNHAKPHSEYIFHNEHAVCWQYQGSKSEIWFLFGPPAGFHYLLQQSFDLFGLIDAGLAIDIQTM